MRHETHHDHVRRLAAALLVAFLVVLLVAATGCGFTPDGAGGAGTPGPIITRTAAPSAAGADHDVTLTVALFPWVPRPQQVEDAVRTVWRERHPDVRLVFADWDCYSTDPPSSLDVFVFDAVYRDRFRNLGLLRRLPDSLLGDGSDFAPAALDAAAAGPNHVWGVPMYLCADLLLYRRGDLELARAGDADELLRVIGEASHTSSRPPKGKGLLVDLSGPWPVGSLYLEAQMDRRGSYTAHPRLPVRLAGIDRVALEDVRDLRRMTSLAGARYVDQGDGFRRTRWFGRGYGRAVVAYSEGLGAMSEDGRRQTALKRLALAGEPDVPLVYVDLVAVNSAMRDRPAEEQLLAEELAGLIGSAEVLTTALGPTRDDGRPQYLMPARLSVFAALADDYPLYQDLEREILGVRSYPLLLGERSREWFDSTATVIRRRVLAAP